MWRGGEEAGDAPGRLRGHVGARFGSAGPATPLGAGSGAWRRETLRRGGSAAGGQQQRAPGVEVSTRSTRAGPGSGLAKARPAHGRGGQRGEACIDTRMRKRYEAKKAVERLAPDAEVACVEGFPQRRHGRSARVRRREGSARGMAGVVRSHPSRRQARRYGSDRATEERALRRSERTCTADTPPLRRAQRAVRAVSGEEARPGGPRSQLPG